MPRSRLFLISCLLHFRQTAIQLAAMLEECRVLVKTRRQLKIEDIYMLLRFLGLNGCPEAERAEPFQQVHRKLQDKEHRATVHPKMLYLGVNLSWTDREMMLWNNKGTRRHPSKCNLLPPKLMALVVDNVK